MKNLTENKIKNIETQKYKEQLDKDVQAVRKSNIEAELFLLRLKKTKLRNKLVAMFYKDEESAKLATEIKSLDEQIEVLKNKI